MTHRYDSESLRNDINEKLSAYSKSAGSFRKTSRGSSVSRTLMYGSLAAVVPLAAAASDARAQCTTAAPYGQVILTSANTTTLIPLGVPSESVRVRFVNNYPDLLLEGIGVNIVGSTDSDSNFIASAFQPSQTVTPGTNGANSAYGCYSGTYGAFCGGSGGVMALRSTGDARLGWLDLAVITLDNTQAVLSVGPRGMQANAEATIHPLNCASLPVELVSFNAIFDMDGVALSWETASELNNAGFELQRASGPEAFRKIAFVEGKGTTSDAQSYRFRDEDTQPNTHYKYRLKQIDLDGTTSFGEIVELFTEDPSQIALSEFYPNPAGTGRAKLEIKVADAVEATVEIYDVRGAMVESRSKMLNAGQNELAFRTNGLAAGSHFAKVQIGERVLYRQFVVAK